MTTILRWLFLIVSMGVALFMLILAFWDKLTAWLNAINNWLDQPHGFVEPDADFYDAKEHRDCQCHKRNAGDGQKDCDQ